MAKTTKLDKVLQEIDNVHAQDPNTVVINGEDQPYELHYSREMSAYLEKHSPGSSDLLRIAICAQHLRRWEVPRNSYPMNKGGYQSWRTALKHRQAGLVFQICLDNGYSEDDSNRVASLVRKENITHDDETRILEDVACLVFLDDQFEEFKKHHDDKKIITILRKTWDKMTERGHELALEISMSSHAKSLITEAVSRT